MSQDNFKLFLETFCKSGEIDEEGRRYLYSEGLKIGLSKESVEMMITSQLKFARKSESGLNSNAAGSGFISDRSVEAPGSGFISDTNKPSDGSGFIDSDGTSSGSFEEGSFSRARFMNETVLDSQGAMSIVSEAKQGSRHVIIKRLRPEHINDPKRLELFYKEFEFLSSLQHDNIVNVYDKGEDEKGPYYYMEKVSGDTLEKKLTGKKMNIEEIKNISVKILDALQYLHGRGIIHRDLKPGNIMVNDKTGKVKLIDLGLAYSDEFTDNLAKAGTPRYMAPEMDGEKDFDKTTDIYSFGLVLLEMFTGDVNIKDASKVKPAEWQNIIKKCLKPKRKDRYQFCSAIAEDINRLLVGKQRVDDPEQKEKVMSQLIDKYYRDGVLHKEEEKLLYKKADEIEYPKEKLELEINLKKKEVVMEAWEVKKNLWFLLLAIAGFVAGIAFCIVKSRGFWSYLYIPILWSIASATFILILNSTTKKTQKLPSQYSPKTKIFLIIIYFGLSAIVFLSNNDSSSITESDLPSDMQEIDQNEKGSSMTNETIATGMDEVDVINKVCEDYYACKKWEDRLAYVWKPNSVKTKMAEYYGTQGYSPWTFDKTEFAIIGSNFKNGDIVRLRQIRTDGIIYLRKVDDRFLMDWEATGQFNKQSLKSFVAVVSTDPTVFRLNVLLDEWYDSDHGITSDNFYSFMIKDDSHFTRAYLSKDNKDAEDLFKLVQDGKWHGAIIEIVNKTINHIKYPENKDLAQEDVFITKFIQDGWAVK